MIKRAGIAAAVAALAFTMGVPPAQGAPPVRETETFSFDSEPVVDEALSEACGFTVTARSKGHITTTFFFDRATDELPSVIHANPSFATVYEGENGGRVETSDRGLDKYTFLTEDQLLYFGTGIHLKIKGQAYSIGLWRLTFDVGVDDQGDPTFDLQSAEYSGNFEVEYPGLLDAVCEALEA